MTAFLPTFIEMDTGNLWLAGAALTVLEAAGVAGALTSGSLSDYFGRRRVLLVALVGAPICLLLFVWTEGWLSFLMLIFTGITLLSTTPVMLALVQENASKSPSAANGMFMAASFIARSGVVVIIGLLGDWIGLHTTFIISAGIGFLGIPFIFLLPKK